VPPLAPPVYSGTHRARPRAALPQPDAYHAPVPYPGSYPVSYFGPRAPAHNLHIDASLGNGNGGGGVGGGVAYADDAMDDPSLDGLDDRISELEMSVGLEPLTPLAAAVAQRDTHSTLSRSRSQPPSRRVSAPASRDASEPPSRAGGRRAVYPISMAAIRQPSQSCGSSPFGTPNSPPPSAGARTRAAPCASPVMRPVGAGSPGSLPPTPLSPTPLAGGPGMMRRSRATTAPLESGAPRLPLGSGRGEAAAEDPVAAEGAVGAGGAAGAGPRAAACVAPRLWGGSLAEAVAAAEACDEDEQQPVANNGVVRSSNGTQGGSARERGPPGGRPPARAAALLSSMPSKLTTRRYSSTRGTPRATQRSMRRADSLSPAADRLPSPLAGLRVLTPTDLGVLTPSATAAPSTPPSQPLSPEGSRALWSGGLPSQQPSPR